MWPNGIKIDLPDGTEVQPQDAEVWTDPIDEDWAILVNVYKHRKEEWRGALTQLADTTARSYLNTLEVDDLIECQMGGFNLVEVMSQTDKPIVKERGGEDRARVEITAKKLIEDAQGEARERIGRELVAIYVSDYGLPKEVVAARRRARVDTPLEEEAAVLKGKRLATEIGVPHAALMKQLMDELDLDREDALPIAERLLTYYKGAESKSLIDWRSPEGAFMGLVGQVVRAAKQAGGGDEKQREA